MRKLILFIATSLDGYIADMDGKIDWLFENQDQEYKEFYETIDCLIMGSKTYLQCLKLQKWHFPEKEIFVFSHSLPAARLERVHITNSDLKNTINTLKQMEGKDIWLVGGGNLATQALQHGLIDDYHIYTHPVLLGSGVRLFQGPFDPQPLDLQGVKEYDSGLVLQKYKQARAKTL